MKQHTQWIEYYDNTRDLPPRPLLVQALKSVTTGSRAIDIGGGALQDTRYLLSKGFDVTVIDQEPLLLVEAENIKSDRLHCIVTSFENFDFGTEQYDITSAMYALPFNSPNTFSKVFNDIRQSLVKGGIFTGHFFGVHDEWATRQNMTFHTKAQVEDLLSGMEIIFLNEEERDGTIASGAPKHWHLFHTIAKKL